jgi:predicted nucleic acid-binding Zn ribbon protein
LTTEPGQGSGADGEARTPGSPERPEPTDVAAPRGADLARQVLAAAKADARARARAAGHAGRRADTEAGDGLGYRPGQPPAAPADDDREPPRRPRLPGIATPGREWREPTSFGTAVQRLLAARGWRAKAADSSVLARWDAIVGPDISAHATPVSLRDGVLELAAESTAWATQLRFLSGRILGELRGELGPGVVTRINVRGPSAPSWRHGPVQMPGGRGPRDTYG